MSKQLLFMFIDIIYCFVKSNKCSHLCKLPKEIAEKVLSYFPDNYVYSVQREFF